MKTSTLVIIIVIAAIIVAGFLLFSKKQPEPQPQSQQNQQQEATIKLASKEGMGQFMTDKNGMTLYYFPKDNINQSNCTGQCVTAWPMYYTDNVIVSSPLKKEDFGSITREDGAKMTTYKGWPLYYYFQDKVAGDTLGEGVGNVWYIVPEPFYTIMTQNKDAVGGNYLVDPRGMTLYYFTRDTHGTATTTPVSVCTDACLAAWPVFYTDNVIAPSLLKKTDFSTITRADGSKQLVYKGWPLYYYAVDKNPGDTLGENVNGVWFVVKP